MEDIALKIKSLLEKGLKRKDICEKLNITINQYKGIQQKYKLNSLPKEKEKLYMNKEWLEEMYNKYHSAKKIAELCGVKDKTITKWRKILGIPKVDKSFNAKKYNANYSFFETIDTEEKAYWLGFIMADGCVSIKTENSLTTKIAISNKDKDHLNKFLKSIKGNHPIIDSSYVNNFTDKITYESYIRICNKKMGTDLIKHGCIPNKTGKEYISDTIPKYLIRHFIRGFFDGDGCISYYNNRNNFSFELCSSSIKILEQIKNIINEELNINIDIKNFKDTGKYNVDFYKIKIMNINKNLLIYNYLYKDATIYLDRKYHRVQSFFNKSSSN